MRKTYYILLCGLPHFFRNSLTTDVFCDKIFRGCFGHYRKVSLHILNKAIRTVYEKEFIVKRKCSENNSGDIYGDRSRGTYVLSESYCSSRDRQISFSHLRLLYIGRCKIHKKQASLFSQDVRIRRRLSSILRDLC